MDQDELLAPYAGRYFDAWPDIWRDWGSDMAQFFTEVAYPRSVISQQAIDETDAYIERTRPPAPLRRLLIERRDDVARALRCRQRDARPADPALLAESGSYRGLAARAVACTSGSAGSSSSSTGPARLVAQRDAPVRVLVAGAGDVLRPGVADRVGQRDADQQGGRLAQVAVERHGELASDGGWPGGAAGLPPPGCPASGDQRLGPPVPRSSGAVSRLQPGPIPVTWSPVRKPATGGTSCVPTVAMQARRQCSGRSGVPSGSSANHSIMVPRMPCVGQVLRVDSSTVPRSSPMATAPARAGLRRPARRRRRAGRSARRRRGRRSCPRAPTTAASGP